MTDKTLAHVFAHTLNVIEELPDDLVWDFTITDEINVPGVLTLWPKNPEEYQRLKRLAKSGRDLIVVIGDEANGV